MKRIILVKKSLGCITAKYYFNNQGETWYLKLFLRKQLIVGAPKSLEVMFAESEFEPCKQSVLYSFGIFASPFHYKK